MDLLLTGSATHYFYLALTIYREPKSLQFNQKNGTYCDAADQAGPALTQRRVSRGLAVGDLFNDGNMDVVIEDLDGGPMLLRNRGIPAATGSALNWQAQKATAWRLVQESN